MQGDVAGKEEVEPQRPTGCAQIMQGDVAGKEKRFAYTALVESQRPTGCAQIMHGDVAGKEKSNRNVPQAAHKSCMETLRGKREVDPQLSFFAAMSPP